jgi:hypothetical protein
MMEQMFNGPVPGESLTREPGNAPWEQPAQFDTVQQVVGFYVDKFDDDDALEGLLNVLDKGMAVEHFVSSLLLYGEMEGKHTTDVSILAGPVLHKYIVFLADSAGIQYKEFQDSPKPDKLKEDLLSNLSFTEEELADDESVEESPMVLKEPEEAPIAPKGLIKRRE